MSKSKITIWGRDLELDIIFDCYEGEDVLDTQRDALSKFLDAQEAVTTSENAVKQYCVKRSEGKIVGETTDIFKCLRPESLYVQRRNDEKRVVGILCEFAFDPELGAAIVFENEKYKEVGPQNIIL
jgi:hypothetical protein